MSEPIRMTQSFVRLETNGPEERLLVQYVLGGLDVTRKSILLRRACAILADEEKRLYELSDQKAIEELDALKAVQDSCKLTFFHDESAGKKIDS